MAFALLTRGYSDRTSLPRGLCTGQLSSSPLAARIRLASRNGIATESAPRLAEIRYDMHFSSAVDAARESAELDWELECGYGTGDACPDWTASTEDSGGDGRSGMARADGLHSAADVRD